MKYADMEHPTTNHSPQRKGLGPFCRLVLWLMHPRRGVTPARALAGLRQRFLRWAGPLWESARPVLFLTGLCILAGLPLSAISVTLGLVFIAAGAAALVLSLWMTARARAPIGD